jgi:hypothetical protein
MEVKVMPGAIPDDMTQEELDEMLETIQKMADDGTLFENSEPISDEELAILEANGLLTDEDITTH